MNCLECIGHEHFLAFLVASHNKDIHPEGTVVLELSCIGTYWIQLVESGQGGSGSSVQIIEPIRCSL